LTLVFAILVLAGLGLILSASLALAASKFAVEVDPRIEQIAELLPNVNCGACGYAGCSGLAEAIVKGEAEPTACAPGGPETAKAIAKVLGIEITEVEPKVAVVHCAGDNSRAKRRFEYIGLDDCRAAHELVGGPKVCPDGCLGLGSCARACPFDAITILPRGIAYVDPDKCTGCGKCVSACPRNLIELVPKSARFLVLCSTSLPPKEARKACEVACISCRRCIKEAPKGTIDMVDSKIRIDYKAAKDVDLTPAATVCPTSVILDLNRYSLKRWLTDPEAHEDFKKFKKEEQARRKAAKAAQKQKVQKPAEAPEKTAQGS